MCSDLLPTAVLLDMQAAGHSLKPIVFFLCLSHTVMSNGKELFFPCAHITLHLLGVAMWLYRLKVLYNII